jgi:probable F420-dependent oxidoreductase
MDFGMGLPICGEQTNGEVMVRFAQEAERLGYTTIWTGERLLYPESDATYPNGERGPLPNSYKSVYDPIETLAYVASQTKRVKLGTSILVAPLHTPLVLANRFAALDQLSGGRVIVGLGQGWVEQEFIATNATYKAQGRGMNEYLAVLRACWGPDPVSFEGDLYHIPLGRVNPKPAQKGGIPIILASGKQSSIERTARIADGLNLVAFSFDALKYSCDIYHTALKKAGHDLSTRKIYVRVNKPTTTTPLPENGRSFLSGSPEQVAQDIEKVKELGIDHIFWDDQDNSNWEQMLEFFGHLQAILQF